MLTCTVAKEFDDHGNMIMKLNEINLGGTIRFAVSGNKPYFSEMDAGKTILGRDSNQTGDNTVLSSFFNSVKNL
jgi:hypothetical protein